VKAFDMVDVKVAEEQKYRFRPFDMIRRPVDAVSG